jgi:hypothetical protein
MHQIHNVVLSIASQTDGGLTIRSPQWSALAIGPLYAGVTANGRELQIVQRATHREEQGTLTIVTEFAPLDLCLVQSLEVLDERTFRLRSELDNRSGETVTLNAVQLLQLQSGSSAQMILSKEPEAVRLFEQGGTWATVRDLSTPPEAASRFCWVGYDRESRWALCVGFETGERWLGSITTENTAGRNPHTWQVGFDGGDTSLEPQEKWRLEDVLLTAGQEPWDLLERYATWVQRRHHPPIPNQSPVTWCSWYPYRLGVTEERVLENARIAAQRLKPLGLENIEVDLGWERDYLPSTFEENPQFPHGLAWLAQELENLGFRLGAWKAPWRISEHDPVARDHPAWLYGGDGKKPLSQGKWYWEPFGAMYVLDVTHPGAQEWLRAKIRGLTERGVRYFKFDFLRYSAALRERHNPRVVAGGGCEAQRLGLHIMLEEIKAVDPTSVALCIASPDLPGTGAGQIIYICDDTGNTGYLGWPHLQRDYGVHVAGSLWKHGKWAVIEPSCLCVGLPGTLEEARVRATATFLSGGEVDISDDFTTLPEDRWQVLEATLPPTGKAARPVDLFDPIEVRLRGYDGLDCGDETRHRSRITPQGSRVWHLPVEASWDEWHLVGVFNYDLPLQNPGKPDYLLTTFSLPLERFGLDAATEYWVYEFWSGQFLGAATPRAPEPNVPKDYVHAGDVRTLLEVKTPGVLELTFFGPSVKLLALRRARPHPWVTGTSFHQSCGIELKNVTWNADGVLSGELHRPAGQQGYIVIANAGEKPASAWVDGREVTPRRSANRSLLLPIQANSDSTSWEVRWPR